MNDGTWVWYTMAVWMLVVALPFVIATMRANSVVAARRTGWPAGGLLALSASALIFASLGTVVRSDNGAEFSLALGAIGTIVFCALVLVFATGTSLVGVAWAEDVQVGAPNKHVRMLLGVAVPFAVVLFGLISYWVTRTDLPDRIASHFGNNGADDSMTVGEFAIATSVMSGVGLGILIALAASRNSIPPMAASGLGFLGGFLAGLGVGLFGFALLTQRGLRDWRDASPGLATVGALAVALGLSAGATRLSSKLSTLATEVPDPSQSPTMDLRPGQNAVWSTTQQSRALLLSGLAIGLMAIVIIVAQGWTWWVIPMMGVSTLITLALSRLRVSADAEGLHVKYGFLPWPSTTVAVDRIDSASVIDVRPMEWGGWGYRGSLKLMRQAAIVHRAGPGIRLDLADGKIFVVTVDDPETPVALLNAKVNRLPA